MRVSGNERSPGDAIQTGDFRRGERSTESSTRGMMSPTSSGGKRETVYSGSVQPSRSASAGLQGFNLLDGGDPPASAAHPSSEREVRPPTSPTSFSSTSNRRTIHSELAFRVFAAALPIIAPSRSSDTFDNSPTPRGRRTFCRIPPPRTRRSSARNFSATPPPPPRVLPP